MNCSQLLEKRATTNWERSTPSPREVRENLSELRSQPRPWGMSRPSAASSAERTFSQRPFSSVR
jgi:hypothetical protein